MANVIETGVLLGIRPLDFVNKQTGEAIKGVKIVMARPAREPQYDGYGMTVYDLNLMGDTALSKTNQFLEQSKGLFMKLVDVHCEMVLSGKRQKLFPISISVAKSSIVDMQKAS